MAKIMAVSSAQNAVSSVATGKMVAAGVSSGVGGSALGGSGSSSNSVTTTVVVATAVAAATLAGIFVSETGQSLLCPNVVNPDFFTGGMAIDFIRSDQRKLTTGEATSVATSLIETYNELFGCNAEFSRVIINCTVPCDRPTDLGVNSTDVCCDDIDDPYFGILLRCTFVCVVHCRGCSAMEPLFSSGLTKNATQNSTIDTTTRSKSKATENRYLQNNPATSCDNICQVVDALERTVCNVINTTGTCLAARYLIFRDVSTMENGNAYGDSDIADSSYLAEMPSYQPTSVPSFAPSFTESAYPSYVPSLLPSKEPSTAPTVAPTWTLSSTPSIVPSQEPSVYPSFHPAASPSAYPTFTPSLLPSFHPTSIPSWSPTEIPSRTPSQSPSRDAVFDLVLYDDTGRNYGSLHGKRVNIAEVGSALTVKADVSSLVDAVFFYFNDSLVSREGIEPFFINQNDENNVGYAYPPIATLGKHNITAIGEDSNGIEIGRQTAVFTTIYVED